MAELKKLQENGIDIYPVTLEDAVFDIDGTSIKDKYQSKTDNTLNTTDKTIVGAINEVFQLGNNVKQNLVDTLVAKGVSVSTSDTFDIIINGINNIATTVDIPTWITNKWIQSTNINTAVGAPGVASYGDYIYIIGGQTGDTMDDVIATVQRFNTKTGAKSTMTSIPTAGTYYNLVVTIGSKIYIVGDTMYCYNISSNSWTTITDTGMYANSAACACSLGNNIYRLAGYASDYNDNGDFVSYYSRRNSCYSTTTNTITEKAQMTVGRQYATCSIVSSNIYCIGGRGVSGYLSTNECYDTTTNTWTTKTSMTTAKYGHTSQSINNKIYVVGGSNTNGMQTTNYCYDPSTDTWTTKAATPIAKYCADSAVSNGWMYVIGGRTDTSGTITNTNYCYIP